MNHVIITANAHSVKILSSNLFLYLLVICSMSCNLPRVSIVLCCNQLKLSLIGVALTSHSSGNNTDAVSKTNMLRLVIF